MTQDSPSPSATASSAGLVCDEVFHSDSSSSGNSKSGARISYRARVFGSPAGRRVLQAKAETIELDLDLLFDHSQGMIESLVYFLAYD